MKEIDIDHVKAALAGPRPGLAAQIRLAPRPRPGGHIVAPGHHPRPGGVLLLLYPRDGTLHIALTRRADTLLNHKGQISFPGGAREGDEPLLQTALRETQEELGVDPATLEVLGELTPLYIGASNYLITPFVARAPARPEFRPDPTEVAEVLEVSLAVLMDAATLEEEVWDLRGTVAQVPFFRIGPHKIWGATAMILAEFMAILTAGNDQ